MKIAIENRTIDLPDQITVGQMISMDLTPIIKLQSKETNLEDLTQIQPLLSWLVKFLKILNVDLYDSNFVDLVQLLKSPKFATWLQGLFGNLF